MLTYVDMTYPLLPLGVDTRYQPPADSYMYSCVSLSSLSMLS